MEAVSSFETCKSVSDYMLQHHRRQVFLKGLVTATASDGTSTIHIQMLVIISTSIYESQNRNCIE
jgi:hypothetical protein